MWKQKQLLWVYTKRTHIFQLDHHPTIRVYRLMKSHLDWSNRKEMEHNAICYPKKREPNTENIFWIIQFVCHEFIFLPANCIACESDQQREKKVVVQTHKVSSICSKCSAQNSFRAQALTHSAQTHTPTSIYLKILTRDWKTSHWKIVCWHREKITFRSKWGDTHTRCECVCICAPCWSCLASLFVVFPDCFFLSFSSSFWAIHTYTYANTRSLTDVSYYLRIGP